MSDSGTGEECPVCEFPQTVKVMIDLTCHQMTDRGRVTCHLVLPVYCCPHCGFEVLDAEGEAMVDAAVRREYDKLPPASGCGN